MSLPDINIKNDEISFESLLRMYNKDVFFFEDNQQFLSHEQIGFAIEKILMGHRIIVDGISTCYGRKCIPKQQNEIFSILEFIKGNVKITSDIIEDIDCKTFEELNPIYKNKIIEAKASVTLILGVEESKSWLKRYMNYDLTDERIEKFMNM